MLKLNQEGNWKLHSMLPWGTWARLSFVMASGGVFIVFLVYYCISGVFCIFGALFYLWCILYLWCIFVFVVYFLFTVYFLYLWCIFIFVEPRHSDL